jgi:glycosyltransferase involved in cell wall biosynthesis
MHKKPVLNNFDNPLISVFIYNYYSEHLEECFNTILNQTVLNNIEIVFLDNASEDGSWDVAVEFARKYDGIITIQRNKRNDDEYPKFRCWRMSSGKYYVDLTENNKFLPNYIKQCVSVMESDQAIEFDMVERKPKTPLFRTNIHNTFRPNVKNKPLVSVLIHNYNYGRYLRQCLDSVYSQTYDNFEIIFSDNASTDDSWDIAVEYSRKYPGSMTIIRNRTNFGPSLNAKNCYDNASGKYYCTLCSDDAFEPEFIMRCVQAMETHPHTGFAITHRTIINEQGEHFVEPSFYNQSCIIPGAEQAAVYMMAAVNPSVSQIMYNFEKAYKKLPSEGLLRWFAQRMLDFNLCCEFDVVYIDEPLLLNRMHSCNESLGLSDNLVEVFAQYILAHKFVEVAILKDNMTKAIGRLPMSLEKIGNLCLRYCVGALVRNDGQTALRYFQLSSAIAPNIIKETAYQKLNEYWTADDFVKSQIIDSLQSTDNLLTRSVSYDPPPGSIPIKRTSDVLNTDSVDFLTVNQL